MSKCGKVRLRTQVDALIALEKLARKMDVRSKHPIRYYRCPQCKGFHLTSVEYKEKQ